MDIKLADIILVRGIEPVSRIIEEVECSPYSHTTGLVKENELIEAQGLRPTGYQALDYYKGCADVFTCDTLTDIQRKLIIEYVEDEVGSRYDWLLLIWEFIRYKLHILLPYKEYTNRICSTLWADAYKQVGIYLCPDIIYPSPADLANSKLMRKVGSI